MDGEEYSNWSMRDGALEIRTTFGTHSLIIQPADHWSPAVRVISVVGFIESGKTTTITALARHLTSQRQRVAFLSNDVGEVQIDGAVIRAGGHEVVEI